MTPSHLFLYGRTPALSAHELQAVLARYSPATELLSVRDEVGGVASDDVELPLRVFHELGGALKVLAVVASQALSVGDDRQTQLLTARTALLETLYRELATGGKAFAIGEVGFGQVDPLELMDVKKELKAQRIPSRFIKSPRTGLSAAVLLHQSVTEYIFVAGETTMYLAKTLAVQDIDDWTQRDRGKPYANRRKGMLPPKLARIMVNLTQLPTGACIYDPFCGTGTVLAEAMLAGYDVVGSDLDAEAVRGSQINLHWLQQKYPETAARQARIFTADVTQASTKELPNQVSAIVTEPFLGKQTPKAQELPNIFRGLTKLYLGAFRHWSTFLRPGAVVAIVLPIVPGNPASRYLESLIDKFADLGYTAKFEPVTYARPEAVIQRQIFVFSYTGAPKVRTKE